MKQQIQIIIPDNKYCIIKSDDYELLRAIDRQFSYKQEGIMWSRAVQTGRWDGTTHLLQKNKLPLGLLEQLKNFLATMGYEALIDDHRPELVIEPEIDLKGKLAQLGTPLRDYQERIVDVAFRERKGIVRSCTGSGKTLAISALIAKLNQPTNVYVVGLDLLGQFHRTLSELFDEEIGFIGNGVCITKRINVISVWTAGRVLGLKKDIIDDESTGKEVLKAENNAAIINALKQTPNHIFDESHIVSCHTIREIFKIIDPVRVYGFSGTPFRDDGTQPYAEGWLGPMIIDVSASELIEKGHLAKPYIKFIPVAKKKIESQDYHSVYRDYIVENEQRNGLVVHHTKLLLAKGYRTLILFKNIRHGEILQQMMIDSGIEVEMLSGQDSLEQRDKVKEKMQSGELKVILASVIFDIGVDLTSLSAMILAGGGVSSLRCRQRVGRAIRKYPGKDRVAIIEFADDAKYLKQHSRKRYETYKSEDGFVVRWIDEK